MLLTRVTHREKLLYPNSKALDTAQEILKSKPGLVQHQNINSLNQTLELAHQGKAFMMQLGDCSERFSENSSSIIIRKYSHLVAVKNYLEKHLNKPIILIGRIAGQYAKPRSSLTEFTNGQKIYTYHGDMINAEHSSNQSRMPDPNRILQAYESSRNILSQLSSLDETIFTSHEAFLLEYEKPLTREINGQCYNLSTHFPWLGMRNIHSINHINYLANIRNPIALKIGPQTPAEKLPEVIKKLNPSNRPGKITLITRLGVTHVESLLPKLMRCIRQHKLNVIWMCDPLHGNTHQDVQGKKFRRVCDAVIETVKTVETLAHDGSSLNGLHLESTHETDVTECITSEDELTPNRAYKSALDPRLNHGQTFDYLNQVLKSLIRETEQEIKHECRTHIC